MGRFADRLARRRSPLAADAVAAIRCWAEASSRLAAVVGSGSVLSSADRVVALVALRRLLDSPATDSSLDLDLLDHAHALESRLMADDLAAANGDSALDRLTEAL